MKELNSQAREFVSRSEVLPFFVRDGFLPYIPAWDEGIDFIVYREQDDLLIKIQLKSRWSIDRKYIGRNIGMLFGNGGDMKEWYLFPHDVMVSFAQENTEFLKSKSWNAKHGAQGASRDVGLYNVPKMSRLMEQYFASYKLSQDESNNTLFEKFRLNQ